ncbi:MAG: hypothetical protein ABI165_22210 [Bryobacteraceae bacterium]
MIPVKAAVAKAVEFAQTVLEPAASSQLLLEEVEIAERNGRDVWNITLSMPRDLIVGLPTSNRDYKTFTVDGETGEVLSMKIRELAGMR